MRKATAFWLEGSPRTTVRFVEHDTAPTGPPIKVPPRSLKGEAAEWVDAKLQEEVARGQLERGPSPGGIAAVPDQRVCRSQEAEKEEDCG